MPERAPSPSSKTAEPGGAAIISGGGCLIVGSPLQKQNGIHDTPDLAFKDWIAWGGPSADAVWARYYIEHTLHDLYHWAEGFGVKWVDLKVQEGNSVHALDPARAQRSRPDDPPDRRLSPEGRRDRSPRPRSPGSRSRAAASPACKAAMPRPASRWRCAARPSSWRPAASTRTSTWCSSSIPLSATTRCWKDRGAARPAADTSSFARPAAISPTWTTSGSTSTPRPTTATRRSAAASCSAWCPATSGSTSRAAASTTRRCRAATRRPPR